MHVPWRLGPCSSASCGFVQVMRVLRDNQRTTDVSHASSPCFPEVVILLIYGHVATVCGGHYCTVHLCHLWDTRQPFPCVKRCIHVSDEKGLTTPWPFGVGFPMLVFGFGGLLLGGDPQGGSARSVSCPSEGAPCAGTLSDRGFGSR